MEEIKDNVIMSFSPFDEKGPSDISVANIISSVLANGRVESQLVWQRYSAMLIANGIFLGFLLGTIGNNEQFVVSCFIQLIGCIAGILISITWRNITVTGWELQKIWFDYVDSIKFDKFPLINPVKYFREKRKSDDKKVIFKSAIFLIWLFIVMYCFSAFIVISKLITIMIHNCA